VLAGLHRIYGAMPGIERGYRCPARSTTSSPDCAKSSMPAAESILLNPVGRDVAEDREQMERLAAEVIPQLS